MGKMHELLAVEQDQEQQAKRIIKETEQTFKNKETLFYGYEKTWEMFDEARQQETPNPEKQVMTTTVDERLQYTFGFINKWIDISFQKEATNQLAKQDVVVDGVTIIKDAPATFLLGLEKKVKLIREMVEKAPTLANGIKWEFDSSINAYRMVNPEERFKTEKTFKHKVLYEATDHHPAQIEKWDEQVNIGKSTRQVWSGMLTSAAKAEYLNRLDKLSKAVKQARQRANNQEVTKVKCGQAIWDYLAGK